jgi:multiple sugar transport system ATP-binding protein
VLINMVAARYDGSGTVTAAAEGSRPVPVTESADAGIRGRSSSDGLTLAFRPETVRLVAPDDDAAAVRATVVLVEPLGARDVIHLRGSDGTDLRAALAPGGRPKIGDNVGLAVDPERVHVFDDASGLVLR